MKKNKSSLSWLFGNSSDIIMAFVANIISWIVCNYFPSYLSYLVSKIEQEVIDEHDDENDFQHPNNDTTTNSKTNNTATQSSSVNAVKERTKCIVIGRPGGIEQLRCITLKSGIMTCGYNAPNQNIPFTGPIYDNDSTTTIPSDCVIVRVEAFSINYADCCIRWGLYESANEYVGYPIIPGFDIAGTVDYIGSNVTQFVIGDRVFGCTLFGAYSTRVLIPEIQLQLIPTVQNNTNSSTPSSSNNSIPRTLSMIQAASIPAVALTSLYALFLAGYYHPHVPTSTTTTKPPQHLYTNQSILIHSAAGGVGSMLIQMSKILGLSPIVGIVGNSNKVQTAINLGCDHVIDKSLYKNKNNYKQLMWYEIRSVNSTNNGLYSVIMDPNGIETIQSSYQTLAPTGRLIVYGFHTNLPINSKSPLSLSHWLNMAYKMLSMPMFHPMDMTTSNKSILAFNLSFFDSERNMLSLLFQQVIQWLQSNQLQCPTIFEMSMNEIQNAHELIQSGTTVGKLVITTPNYRKQE